VRARWPVVAAAVIAVAGLPACGVGRFAAAPCLPSPLVVEPDRAAAGVTVTVSSGPFECDAEYPPGTRYTLGITSVGSGPIEGPIELGTAEVATDGSFTTEVTVPADLPPGEADVWVRGSLHDDCSDEESCAGYSTLITIG
jgi:hypothetical protein